MKKNYKLDAFDMQILEELEKNSKIKLHILAKKLKIPLSTLHFRITKMEQQGIFTYTINKNFQKIGFPIHARVLVYVDLKELRTANKTQEELLKEITNISYIKSTEIISGEADMLVEIYAKNIEELTKTILTKLQTLIGIKNTKTIMVLKTL